MGLKCLFVSKFSHTSQIIFPMNEALESEFSSADKRASLARKVNSMTTLRDLPISRKLGMGLGLICLLVLLLGLISVVSFSRVNRQIKSVAMVNMPSIKY